ncbi:MAG: ERAP1-like C-terminal domain-containing protein, partial [Gammaproteobacteria bacterium]
DLRRHAFAVAAADGGPDVGRVLLQQLTESGNQRLRQDTAYGLAHLRDQELIAELRQQILDGAVGSSELWFYLYWSLSVEGYQPAWQWLQENFASLSSQLSMRDRSRAGLELARHLCTQQEADQLEQMLQPYIADTFGSERNLQAGLENIGLCQAFVEASRSSAQGFFELNRSSL